MDTNSRTGLLVVDLGGTHLRVAAFDAARTLSYRTSRLTPSDDPSALPAAMRAGVEECGLAIAGAVVGIPSAISYIEGRPLHFPNLPRWDGHVTAVGLANELGFPVALANDADLGALGEHRYGAGRGAADMVYVTVSTGVGAGVVLNGRLAHGRRSLAEIGQTIIDLDTGETLEYLANGAALTRYAGLDGVEATRRALAGDAHALAAFAKVAAALSVGALNVVLNFIPERVVLGGGLMHAGDLLLEPVREFVVREAAARGVETEVLRAELGDDVGLYGGVAFWDDLVASALPEVRPFLARPE